MDDDNLDNTLNSVQFTPSCKRSPAKVAAMIGAGVQLRSRALPQLVPDFLSLEGHVKVALKVAHPASRHRVLFAPAQHALRYQPRDPVTLVQQRAKIVCAMENIEKAIVFEAHCLCRFAPFPTQPVLNEGGPLKNVRFMREVSHVVGCTDTCIFADVVQSSPTVG